MLQLRICELAITAKHDFHCNEMRENAVRTTESNIEEILTMSYSVNSD